MSGMRMYLLSDNVDTLIGMRMSGVDGVVLHEENALREKLSSLIQEDDIAVIFITATLLDLIRETVYDLKLNVTKPLIIEIPDRHGKGLPGDSISQYIKEALGIKLS